MLIKDLKVGDRIRILRIPGEGIPGYTLHFSTRRVYKKIIERNRSVRISEIDERGTPWYQCQFLKKNNKVERHFLSVSIDDNNWVRVKNHEKVKN